jgi:hypothetical protein
MAEKPDDIDEILAMLADPDPRGRVLMLQVLASSPTGSSRLLPRLELLTSDTEVTVLGLPFMFGEVRWAAAHALAAERKIQEVAEPVALTGIAIPLGSDSIARIAETHDVRRTGGIEGLIAAYTALRDQHRVPTTKLEL